MVVYELPTLVCARYHRRALREREAVCHCSGGQMAWSPNPHMIIIPLHVIAPAMLSRLRPPFVVAPLLLLGFAPPLIVALSLSLEIDCPSPPTSHSYLPTFSTLGTGSRSARVRHCIVVALVGREGKKSSEARWLCWLFCQVVAMEEYVWLAEGTRC